VITVTTSEMDMVEPETPILTRESRSASTTSAHSASSEIDSRLDGGSRATVATATATRAKV